VDSGGRGTGKKRPKGKKRLFQSGRGEGKLDVLRHGEKKKWVCWALSFKEQEDREREVELTAFDKTKRISEKEIGFREPAGPPGRTPER